MVFSRERIVDEIVSFAPAAHLLDAPRAKDKKPAWLAETTLLRVNFEVHHLNAFPCLAFLHSKGSKTASILPSCDGELMASSPTTPTPIGHGVKPECSTGGWSQNIDVWA
jgi:hypothetical protein